MDRKAIKDIHDIINEAEDKKVKYAEQPKHDKDYARGMEAIITFIRKRLLEAIGGKSKAVTKVKVDKDE